MFYGYNAWLRAGAEKRKRSVQRASRRTHQSLLRNIDTDKNHIAKNHIKLRLRQVQTIKCKYESQVVVNISASTELKMTNKIKLGQKFKFKKIGFTCKNLQFCPRFPHIFFWVGGILTYLGGGILTYRSKMKKRHKMIKMVNDDLRANKNWHMWFKF